MLKRVAILANGGDISGFNAVIRAILKTTKNIWQQKELLVA